MGPHTRQVPFGPFLFVSTPANCPSGTYIYQGLLRWREGEVAGVATRWGAALWLSAARATTAATGGGGPPRRNPRSRGRVVHGVVVGGELGDPV
mmetsp:Transcript_29442/g.68356  ORF Transcript_29442/g.68356 Transcript_29442/m.68356 type:complete len:94 (-) Transcript_29442:1009-1290(-)